MSNKRSNLRSNKLFQKMSKSVLGVKRVSTGRKRDQKVQKVPYMLKGRTGEAKGVWLLTGVLLRGKRAGMRGG